MMSGKHRSHIAFRYGVPLACVCASLTLGDVPLSGSPTTEAVVWTSLVNASANGSTLTATESAVASGGVSTQAIMSGDGYMEWTVVEGGTNRAAGLSHGNTDVELSDIDFAVRMNGAGNAEVWESDVYRFETTYETGGTPDVFRVAVVAGQVRYSKNGVVFYTSTNTPTYPLLVDAAMYNLNATISNTVISGELSGSTATWPNEPAGLTVLTDWGLDQDIPRGFPMDTSIPGSPGWKVVYEVSPDDPPNGWAQRVSDPGAPFSRSNVYDFVYPQGMVEGTAPATVYYAFSQKRAVYAAFWWKPSSPFDLGPNGNKIAFLFNGGGGAGGQQILMLRPDGKLHVLPEEYPGPLVWRDPIAGSPTITLGQWHLIEWYCNLDTGALKWWLDGALNGDHTGVTNTHGFDMFQFSPTWGGNIGAQKSQTDHYWFDHVHLSAR